MGPSQISFFVYYIGAPSDKLYRLLYKGAKGPLRSVFFTYYMAPPQVFNVHRYVSNLIHNFIIKRTHIYRGLHTKHIKENKVIYKNIVIIFVRQKNTTKLIQN